MDVVEGEDANAGEARYVGIDDRGVVTEVINGEYFYDKVPEREAYPNWNVQSNLTETGDVVGGLNTEPGLGGVAGLDGRGGVDASAGIGAEEVNVSSDSDVDEDVTVLETVGEDGNVKLSFLENAVGSGHPLAAPVEVPAPTVGMEFNSGIEFVSYMHQYGHSVGFVLRIRCSEKDKMRKRSVAEEKEWKLTQWFNLENKYKHSWKIRLVCRKQGFHKSRSKDPNRCTQSCKTGCLYAVNACRSPRKGTKWRITEVKGSHNHDLNPELSRHLPRYRRIGVEDGIIATELHKAGVKLGNMYDVFVNRYKSYEAVPFTEQDLRNFVYFMNRKPLKDTDFGGMEIHFKKMRELSPDFMYEYDVDENFRLKSVFWADSRCRKAFEEFGDVVSFDTTFVSNRYKMPFAPLIGVNHHGKTMLFGCALISKEDTASFEWVFRMFKKCMGKSPACILTDQDKAIGNAVASEFPGISHRWCIWHVKRNFRKHHGMLPKYHELAQKLEDILHDSFSVEEFEAAWNAWVADYDLGSSTWVEDMFKERARWVPIFFKGNFWAGMSSTQRSEGMNHYLKTFVNINTSLTKFVEKYAKAVCRRIAEEGKDNLVGSDRSSKVTSRHPFEPVFEKLYTREKFLEFHAELDQMNYNIATIKHVENESFVVYDVLVKTFRVGWTRRENFNVSIDRSTLEVKCDCKNFEFRGIMCAHMLRVYWMEETAEVPEMYVLRRWRKDVPRKYLSDKYPAAALQGPEQIEAKRYEEIHHVAQEICFMVMNNEELQKEALESLSLMKSKIEERIANPEGVTSYVRGSVGTVYRCVAKGRAAENHREGERCLAEEGEAAEVKDPIDKRGRGRGQTKRKLSFADSIGTGRRGCRTGGRGRGSGSSTPTSTPVKDVETNMCYPAWDPYYVPQASNSLRHGFKINGCTADIGRSR